MKRRETYLPFGQPDFTDAEIDAAVRVMRSGWLGMGPETLAFEQELAAFTGAPEVVTVNSCTSALFLSLLVSGIGPGDEVIVPSLTWCSTVNAVLYVGATPVFCDIDAETLCASAETVAACLTARTRAVVPVHYGGAAIDIDQLIGVLPPGVAIIEDAAHALGARDIHGKAVGASGRLTCFSFYANKNLSTAEGGAIAVGSVEVAERLRRLRLQGMQSHAWSRYVKPTTLTAGLIDELGYKMNFNDLQAAIGRVQLARFPEMAAKRKRTAERYRDHFARALPAIRFQRGCFDDGHARHLLVGFFDPAQTGYARDDLLRRLRERNVGASIHYAPLHLMPFYRSYVRFPLENTEAAAGAIMTLPISARLNSEDVDYVCEQLFDLIREHEST